MIKKKVISGLVYFTCHQVHYFTEKIKNFISSFVQEKDVLRGIADINIGDDHSPEDRQRTHKYMDDLVSLILSIRICHTDLHTGANC